MYNLSNFSNKLSNFSKLAIVCSTDKKDLSLDGHYGKFYHNPSSVTKCPRCGKSGELIESGPIRSLYQCRDCGIFSKLTPKKRLHGLKQSIAGNASQDDQKGGRGNAGTDCQHNQKTTASNDRCGCVLFEN